MTTHSVFSVWHLHQILTTAFSQSPNKQGLIITTLTHTCAYMYISKYNSQCKICCVIFLKCESSSCILDTLFENTKKPTSTHLFIWLFKYKWHALKNTHNKKLNWKMFNCTWNSFIYLLTYKSNYRIIEEHISSTSTPTNYAWQFQMIRPLISQYNQCTLNPKIKITKKLKNLN